MAQDGLIIESHPLASLTPAVIVRKDSKVVTSWDDLAKDGVCITIINPNLGTAGIIADKVIESSPANDAIRSNITVFSTSINEMIQLLMDGKVDALINWDVVAQTNPGLMAIEIPADINQKLEMWIAIPKYTSSKDDAAGFLEFIKGDEGQQAFKDAGFDILGE
jgi:ABC-type molybdate transport system substrate-binding protein